MMMSYPYPVSILDTRPEGHNSLSTLPRLGPNEIDRLRAFYKFNFNYTYGYERARPGQCFWAITGIELKAGPAILQPQVRDANGALILAKILMFQAWSGAPEEYPAGVDPLYVPNGVAGFTENGSIGWGFGPESHIGPNGGPFTVWASSDPVNWHNRRVGSDAVMALGWWDDHIVPNPIFQEMRKGGTPPAAGTYRLANVGPDGVIRGWITFQAGVESPLGWLSLYHETTEVGRLPWGP